MSYSASKYVKHLVQAPDGKPLTIAEKLILSLLADDHNEDERAAWTSAPKLAMRACMSVVHCRRLLRKLERIGILESMPVLRENGGRSSDRYRFPQIDPPFDKKLVERTRKQIALQENRAAARPKQMSLAPVEKPAHGKHPPDPPGSGPLITQDQAPSSRKIRPPDHPGSGPLIRQDQAPSSPEIRGKEPLFKPPLNPEGKPLPELPLEPKDIPPTPRTRGVQNHPVESADLDASWTRFKQALKRHLQSTPLGVARKFNPIRAGVEDYDAAFRDWQLEEVGETADNMVLVTNSPDPDATRRGIAKFGSRLEHLLRGNIPQLGDRRMLVDVKRST